MKRVTVVIIAAVALLCVVAAGLVSAGCGSSDSSVASDVVATVGGTSVTKAQVEELMTQAKTQFEVQGSSFPAEDSVEYDHYLASVVNYLVQSQVVAQSAKALGVSVSDEEVAAQIDQIEKTNGGEQKLLALLKEQGLTMSLLEQSIKDQALTQEAAAKVVDKAAVSDADVQAYWKAHGDTLRKQKKTATFAKAKAGIRETLLNDARSKLWSAWLATRMDELNVEYTAGFVPAELTASPLPSSSASPAG